jgi:hypothetical protein
MGIAPRTYDNTGGANGDVLGAIDFMKEIRCRGYVNDSAPNNVTRSNIGGTVYHLDDQSVTTLATGRTATRGRVIDVTDATSDMGAFVWLEV